MSVGPSRLFDGNIRLAITGVRIQGYFGGTPYTSGLFLSEWFRRLQACRHLHAADWQHAVARQDSDTVAGLSEDACQYRLGGVE